MRVISKTNQKDAIHVIILNSPYTALSDESVWDLLEMLHGLIDAYEEQYAQTLQRLRHQRYQDLHEPFHDERQLNLPIHGKIDDPF